MALIQCPSCNKRISDKAKTCSHCDFVLAGRSSEDLQREQARAVQRRKDKLLSQSMLALLIAIAAFAYTFLEQPHPDAWQAQVSYGLIVVGLVWFVINRVRIVFLKRGR
ncbi:hypothetical protein PSI9734_00551 [Pseudidiomarina piscicola]|uniref:Zinc-ribbon domain-containing protein n=1 Tax=Pseudidiomarina piscicola TaxID=2614830 RepID=A0A6S6WLC3_9GAMM|nr:zinc ribbon domain-containing protein [Pseudidiomarina piscicola]CAB0149979.1 hypothetical protein PSI9734_00551 [Pseudidiomarina piscicola]VZT39425.1 hypothetical protein PSI9734_00551 [Pseudomonas aeruginosa]